MTEHGSTATAPRAARLRRDQTTSDHDRDGYLLLPRFLSPTGLDAVRAEATAICRGRRGPIDGVVPVPVHPLPPATPTPRARPT